jgi:hypothetical protein
LEIRTVLDWDDMDHTSFWDKEVRKIQRKWKDYLVLEKMDSSEAFRLMEGFIDELEDEKMQEDLAKVLNRKSPFANFKAEVESSPYRQQWFDFRDKKYQEYVEELLKMENIGFEKAGS